ncbi:MAG: hypothetical protein ACRYFL_02810 [Janthinobacterium lividum]
MTEISTSEVKFIKSLADDPFSTEDDLEPHEQHFYRSISSHLNNIQLSPKKETIFKIMAYSKSKK